MTITNRNSYPRGSEWRKWDLHVHNRVDDSYVCLGETGLSEEQITRLINATGLSKAQVTSQEKKFLQLNMQRYSQNTLRFSLTYQSLRSRTTTLEVKSTN